MVVITVQPLVYNIPTLYQFTDDEGKGTRKILLIRRGGSTAGDTAHKTLKERPNPENLS